MRVPDVIPQCVAFLAVEEDNRYVYGGTAVYVGVPFTEIPGGIGYLVTARHNIRKAFENHGNLFVRINVIDGGSE
jgi:hypothetical protein